ncbi:MAG TPA: GNAT family N-acetyltransferase, partial [Micromonosporaceae bacterium]
DLRDLHERASDDMLYRRFLSTGHGSIPREVTRLVRPPAADHDVLVAAERDRIIGVGSYEALPQRDAAEFSIFIDDTAHDRGIGTLLLEHLAVRARHRGITDLVGEILPSNSSMLRVATNLGQPVRAVRDLGFVEVHLDTTTVGSDAIDRRDLAAARHSLTPLFEPRCVAVVGAGREPGGIGHAVLRAIVDGAYTGTLYAINPHADHIAGVPAYPSLTSAPTRPDLVVVAVPATAVASVLADAAAARVRAAVVLSSGFGEEGPDGKARQAEIVRIARSAGIRLVGPNCLGILNTDPAVNLHATFAAGAKGGGLAVASQSGAVAISLLAQTAQIGLGISSFVSLGNKADVSGNDLLSYWYDDPAARVVALYMESVGNPRRFARIARAVARRKPVLAVKSGRTLAGARAGASHTAAAAAPDATVDALFAQAGVIRCDGLGDMVNTARMLVDQPLPAGERVAIVGNAGGVNVLCADAADATGLSVPTFPSEVAHAIRAAAPAAAAISNPVDLGAGATPQAVGTAIRAVAAHVDAIVVAFGATLANDVPGILTAIGEALDEVAVPAAVVLLGVDAAPASLGAKRAPVYPLPEDAIGALARAVRYATWRAQPLGHRPELDRIDFARARAMVGDAVARGGGWQSPTFAADLLAAYGIPVVAQREVATEADAVTAAAQLGATVVLKTADPSLVHKSDIGGVRLGLSGSAAVAAAYRDVIAATGSPKVLIQAQATPGVELVVGIVHDPLFGSVLMCGLGGVRTELLGDRTLRLLPLTDRDAAQMWRDLRGAPLLTGYRGSAPTDTAAVEDLLMRLGRLAEDMPEVAELDANPVIVSDAGVAVVDVKLRVSTVGSEPDAALRSLREPA